MLLDIPFKCILIIINIILSLTGIGLMTIGGIMVWGQSVLVTVMDSVLEPAIRVLQLTDRKVTIQLIQTILSTSGPLGIGIFCIGLAIFGLAFLGFIGIYFDFILYIYSGIVFVMAIAVMVLFSYYFARREQLADVLADLYRDLAVKEYVSLSAKDTPSLTVLITSNVLQCCGDNNYTDFTAMSTTDTFANRTYENLVAPIACCKLDQTFLIPDSTCPAVFTIRNSYYANGCRNFIRSLFMTNGNNLAYPLVGVFIFLTSWGIVAVFGALLP